jgi:hypothetical protein
MRRELEIVAVHVHSYHSGEVNDAGLLEDRSLAASPPVHDDSAATPYSRAMMTAWLRHTTSST